MQLIKIDLELNSADACLAKATKAALEVPYIDLPGISNVDNIEDKRTMALINKPNYSLLQSSLKIDDLIDPRMSTVSSILKHVHKGTIENAYTILNGEYEVIEADIIETSELINKQLKDSNLPDEIRIGAILRDKEVIIPSSSYVFQKDDTIVLLSKRDQLPTVENMFRISSI